MDETPVHKAIREAIANTLIHADYYGTRGVVIEKLPEKLQFNNPGTFRISIAAATEGGVSDPRNAAIFKMFTLIGIGERAGSGLHAIHHVWEQYSFPVPEIIESFNPDRVHFAISLISEKSSEKTEKSSEKTRDKVLAYIKANKHITISELAKKIGISTRAIEKHLNTLKSKGHIIRVGADKGGHWEVIQ